MDGAPTTGGGCAVVVPTAGGATVPVPVGDPDEDGTTADDAGALGDGDDEDEPDGALENGGDPDGGDVHPATTTASTATIPTTCLKPDPLPTREPHRP
ncbi:MAG: hypothetical protein ABIQ18_24280 [Umezawaea sp.]